MTTRIKEIDKVGKEFLTNLVQTSIYGQCYHFAIALHRGLDWPLVGLAEGRNIIHAGVKSLEGKIWDGRGEVSEKEFVEPFTKSSSCIVRDIAEEELLVTGTVKEHAIEFLQKKAQIIWPELPWRQNAYQKRIVAFANELEALSRKHKLWICGTIPTMLPIIFEGWDDEAGYEIQLTSDGNACTINRMIR